MRNPDIFSRSLIVAKFRIYDTKAEREIEKRNTPNYFMRVIMKYRDWITLHISVHNTIQINQLILIKRFNVDLLLDMKYLIII